MLGGLAPFHAVLLVAAGCSFDGKANATPPTSRELPTDTPDPRFVRAASRATDRPAPQPVTPTAGTFVTYPSPEVEFIAGPQLRWGDAANPWIWFDSNESQKGLEHGANFPADPGVTTLSGTVSIAKGSKTLMGSGTHFLSETGAGRIVYLWDAAGQTYHALSVASVQSDTNLTLTLAWWPAAIAGGQALAGPVDDGGAYQNRNYYDLGLTLYLAYYRTGNPTFQTYARKVADSWWKSGGILQGKFRDQDASYAPRSVSLDGLMLRAMDGRPEMWDWITWYTRAMYDVWLGPRLTYNSPYYGVRDGGYTLLYTAQLAAIHPDPAVRAEMRSKALAAAHDYYARLQHADGGWYWTFDDGTVQSQPFQVGLLLEGLVATHQVTGDATVAAAITKAVGWLYNVAYRPAPLQRAMWYTVNLTNPSGNWGATDAVEDSRQLNPTTLHAFGYAYHLTKDPKYLQWGDEVFGASYGRGPGPNTDGQSALCYFREKEYDECYRTGGRYLAWRAGK